MVKKGIKIKCNCYHCGKELNLLPSVYNRSKLHFCNMQCRYAMRKANKTKVNCLYCDKEMFVSPYYIERAYTHFCNSACRKAWKDSRVVDVPCSYCGKIVQRNLHALKRNKCNYCSFSCRGKWLAKNKRAEKHPNWKGGRCKGSGGYIKIFKPDYCNSDSKGYILEHRYILEQKLERSLKRKEVVHHLNGIRDDNRPENSYLTTINDHVTNTVQKIYMARIKALEYLVANIYGCPN